MPSATKDDLDFQEAVIVQLTDAERTSGLLSEEHVALAVAAMHRDGMVVLENAVDTRHLDTLNDILVAEAEDMAKLPTTNFNNQSRNGRPVGNMSQGPPLEPDLMFADVWANQPAATVMSCLLGPRPRVNYVNGNTALGGYEDARQPIHADLSFNHATFPFAIVANYYLVDVGPGNGATEVWLGSHRDTSFRDHRPYCVEGPDGKVDFVPDEFGIRQDVLAARRERAPPLEPAVRKGSVVLRDLRLWHAGVANPGRDARVMLAFVHTPWWYQCPARVVLPAAAEPLVREWAAREVSPVEYHAHYVPAQLDHRKVKFTPNFASKNAGLLSMLPKGLPAGFTFDDSIEEPEVKTM